MPVSRNNAVSRLASAHLSGSDVLALSPGEGERFGDPTVDAPIRVTVAARSTLVNGQIAPTSTQTIFDCTERVDDTLSGLTAVEGTSDQNFGRNDPVASLITWGMIEEIQDTVGTVTTAPTGLLKGVGGTLAAAVASTDYSVPAAVETWTGEKTFADAATHEQVVDFRAPAGGQAQRIYADNTTFPYDLGAVIGAIGNISTGAWMYISQSRNSNGDHIGLAGPDQSTNPSDAEPSMLDVWPDVNGPGIKIQGSDGSGATGEENATCLAFYNSDVPDNRFPGTPYSASTGQKQLVIWGNGRLDWGANLGKEPADNRTASLYCSTATGNATFEGAPDDATTSLDLKIHGDPGTGAAQIVLGRTPSGSPQFQMKTLSSVTETPATTFSLPTTHGLLDALTLTSWNGGTSIALCRAPNLDLSSGINYVDSSGVTKAAWGTAGNLVVGAGTGSYLLSLTGASRGGVYYGLATSTAAAGDILNYASVGAITGALTGFSYSVPATTGFNSTLRNGNSTSTSASSTFELATTGAGGGSPYHIYTIGGVRNVCTGVDNADGDKWKVSFGFPIGTGDVLTISPAGDLAHLGSKCGFNNAAPVAKAASPGTATGTDAAVINAIALILKNLGFSL